MLKAAPIGAVLSADLGDILARKRILVCVGPGGVGKTTTAAALALEAARRGRKTLVLTIDPAKRLANSLGLDALGHDIQQVPSELIDGDGELHAMMLDQKKSFDEIVERYASNPDAVKRIMANPVYAQISGSLAGSLEYAAMAKVEELDSESEFELIVVDTPPTAHALDFLDAPQKLSAAIDSPAIDWFRSMQRGGRGRGVIGRTGAYVLKRLSRFTGSRFLDDLSVFFVEFNDILGGFKARAEKTFELLRTDKVGFVLVASPEAMAVRECLFFFQRLSNASMPFAGFVVNRVHSNRPVQVNTDGLATALAKVPSVAALSYQPGTLRMAAEALLASHRELQVLAEADAAQIKRLHHAAGSNDVVTQVPFFREDIHTLKGLSQLSAYLAPR